MYIFQHDDDDEADDELYDNGKLYERGSLFSGFRWRVQEKSAQYMYKQSKSMYAVANAVIFIEVFLGFFFEFFFSFNLKLYF